MRLQGGPPVAAFSRDAGAQTDATHCLTELDGERNNKVLAIKNYGIKYLFIDEINMIPTYSGKVL